MPINKTSAALINDRFLVQLTKLESPPSRALTPEEIASMWEKVDKSSLVQYKLKVELSPEV
jgi:hypothetical protein